MERPLVTDHEIIVDDARRLEAIASDSVELVVTSPPYPMIEMWDGLFAELNGEVGAMLDASDGQAAFEAMHAELDKVWDELGRVLVSGGIACINIGDATRKVDGSFQLFPNHARVSNAFRKRGFQSLPGVLWRKPTNSTAKFMGSGMLPPNQYVTLEHEHILVFRNGCENRSFEPHAGERYESAYFYEERNRWFSDLWTDIRGVEQRLPNGHDDLRERSAAYPFTLPYRLISMYSIYGDTVLDPFWGTGTTSLAALVAARNSIGYERNSAFIGVFDDRIEAVPELSREIGQQRLADHRRFVAEQRAAGGEVGYEAANYDVAVKNNREREIQLYSVEEVEGTGVKGDRQYIATHRPLKQER